eukprot:Rhum_TRINITY_DN23514_c0_g1::Rhum_TRINITY_DN23514_c0_g1_i1::g.178219::m.178219
MAKRDQPTASLPSLATLLVPKRPPSDTSPPGPSSVTVVTPVPVSVPVRPIVVPVAVAVPVAVPLPVPAAPLPVPITVAAAVAAPVPVAVTVRVAVPPVPPRVVQVPVPVPLAPPRRRRRHTLAAAPLSLAAVAGQHLARGRLVLRRLADARLAEAAAQAARAPVLHDAALLDVCEDAAGADDLAVAVLVGCVELVLVVELDEAVAAALAVGAGHDAHAADLAVGLEGLLEVLFRGVVVQARHEQRRVRVAALHVLVLLRVPRADLLLQLLLVCRQALLAVARTLRFAGLRHAALPALALRRLVEHGDEGGDAGVRRRGGAVHGRSVRCGGPGGEQGHDGAGQAQLRHEGRRGGDAGTHMLLRHQVAAPVPGAACHQHCGFFVVVVAVLCNSLTLLLFSANEVQIL